MFHPADKSSDSAPASPSMEHYVEVIADLYGGGQACSVSEIASRAGVSRPAVSRAMRTLAAQGLVTQEANRRVLLTPSGEVLARSLKVRYRGLHRFLRSVLAYDDASASRDAHHIKHLVNDDFVSRLVQLTVFLEAEQGAGPRWRDRIREHLREIPT